MLAQFSNIETPDMGEIREEVSTMWIYICSLTKSNIPAIPLVIPPIIHPTSPHGPTLFDLFKEDEEMVLVVGTKKSKQKVL